MGYFVKLMAFWAAPVTSEDKKIAELLGRDTDTDNGSATTYNRDYICIDLYHVVSYNPADRAGNPSTTVGMSNGSMYGIAMSFNTFCIMMNKAGIEASDEFLKE